MAYLNLSDALAKAAEEAARMEAEIISIRTDQQKQKDATKILIEQLYEAINQYKNSL